ncbi:hypothetical protein QBC47DRAFT_348025 [Echria macrotheca]|uniref:Uncharacterized protein n=1 Tax=Echria macrotheca TaxID=438768 RepID=A0AAJ0B8S4_9PEZI|nr:hypothetical protein QBC47DRAFT_348025 [Echria macrotheca]
MSRSWWWVTGFTVLSLVANFVFILGCVSPATVDLALYRVNVTLLANGLNSLARQDPSKADALHAQSLPTYWYWGASGVCEVWPAITNCRSAFPPTQDIVSIVRGSLIDHYGGDDTQDMISIMNAWSNTLDKIDPSILKNNEAKFAAQSKASVGLAIVAIVLDFAVPFIVLAFDSSSYLYFLFPFISGLLALAAGALAMLSMHNGVHGVINTGEGAGPGILALFVGGGLRLVSCLSGPCCSSRREKDDYYAPELGLGSWGAGPPQRPFHNFQDPYQSNFQNPYQNTSQSPLRNDYQASPVEEDRESRNKRIGYEGEHYIFQMFGSKVRGWGLDNWTSKLRNRMHRYPEWHGSEYHHADFTYDDEFGDLKLALGGMGVPVMPEWSTRTTYHLEIKTTPGECHKPFVISANQVRLMQLYDQDPDNAFILVRVFGTGGGSATTRVRYYPNPWSLKQSGHLQFVPMTTDGGYQVTPTY